MGSENVSISIGSVENCVDTGSETLHRFFEKQLDKNPHVLNHLAVKDADRTDTQITFAELNKKANKLARCLVDRIGKHRNQMHNGFSYLPIAPDWPKERIEYLLEDSKPLAILTNKTDYKNDAIEIISFSSIETKHYNENNLVSNEMYQENVSDTYAVMYTSGSSGLPKGVRLLHKSVLQRIHWQWRLLPYQGKDDICAFKAALTFIDAVSEIYSALLSCHTLVVFPVPLVKDVTKFVKALATNHVSRLYLIPSLMKNMLEVMKTTNEMLPALQQWESTGEALTLETAQAFFQTFPNKERTLCNIYGGTEMMDNIYELYHTIDDFKSKALQERQPSLGQAVDNSVVYIMNEDLQPVEEGEVGEICITGIGIASEYIGRHKEMSELSFPPFVNDIRPEFNKIYRTGDYGKMIKGRIYYEGRRDAQIKVRGQRVNLVEVEQAILKNSRIDQQTLVKECKVLVARKNTPFQTIVAFYTSKGNHTLKDQSKIYESLKEIIPLYMIPRLFPCERFPTLVNGKVDRQKLIENYEKSLIFEATYSDQELNSYGCTNPQLYERARIILNAICSVIGLVDLLQKPTLSDNFFQIGGTSINAVHAVAKINENFSMPIESFISARTIGELVDDGDIVSCKRGDDFSNPNKMTDIEVRPMRKSDKDMVLKNQAMSFCEQETLALAMDIEYKEALNFWTEVWKAVEMCMSLSLVAVTKSEEYLGHLFGMDHHTSALEKVMNEPNTQAKVSEKMSRMLDFVASSEATLVSELYPPEDFQGGGVAFETLYMATNRNLSPEDNLKVVKSLESGIVRLAATLGYKAIVCLNSSPVTQHLAINDLGYKRLRTLQINRHIDPKTGAKLFPISNNDVVVTMDVKFL